MTISLPSYLKTLSLAALLVLPTLAFPVEDSKLRTPVPSDSLPASDAQSAGASRSTSGNSFQVGLDITVIVATDSGGEDPSTAQLSNVDANNTLTALYKTFLEPSNAKLDPLNGPLNVTVDGTKAGITPTDFSSWGSEAPPPSFAQLPYARWARIVQGLQTFLGSHKYGDEFDFSVTRVVPGGGSEGVPQGAVVAKGFLRLVAGD